VAVLILRKTDPERHRPFKVPFAPWFPIMGIICCGGLMFYSMQFLTTSRFLFPLWLILGIIIYFSYSYKEKRKVEKNEQ
jgi:APA family basic amino acid/polyamine antiporter